MTSTFARARGGRVKVRLGDADRGVVAGLLEAVADLLDPQVELPDDRGLLVAGGEALHAEHGRGHPCVTSPAALPK